MPDPVAQAATDVLRALDLWRLPVDPFEVARQEGIELAPGLYGRGRFDARIEYFAAEDGFGIFYRTSGPGRPLGRIRFSIAHELGHYYLPHHRTMLRHGLAHNSTTNFRSGHKIEREADEFAAALLMPRQLLVEYLKRKHANGCDLHDLSGISDALGTSLTSTVLRYCQCCAEACLAVFSTEGRVAWCASSDDMAALRMGYLARDVRVPPKSLTSDVWRRLRAGELPGRLERVTDAEVWFDDPSVATIWEEVMPLGGTGWVLTLLTADLD